MDKSLCYRSEDCPGRVRDWARTSEWLDSILMRRFADVKSLLVSKLGLIWSMELLILSNDGLGRSKDGRGTSREVLCLV